MKAEYIPFVEELIELAIKEDIGDGDHTSDKYVQARLSTWLIVYTKE